MTRLIPYMLMLVLSFWTKLTAQNQNDAVIRYNQFKQQAKKEYEDYRNQCNKEYADFLRKAWESYQAGPIIPSPKDETVPPVVMPQEDINHPIESNPIPIDTVVAPIVDEPQPQPKPISPIYERTQPTENSLTFMFFGTEGKVRIPKEKPISMNALETDLSGNALSDSWSELSCGEFDNLIRDCLELRIRHQLSDWAYLLMLHALAKQYYGEATNSATLLMSWIYCQTGYQMRLAIANRKLYLLFGSQHQIYDWPYYDIEGTHFYPFMLDEKEINESVQVCGASFPKEQPLSLLISSSQTFAKRCSPNRIISSTKYADMQAKVNVNLNLIDFYNTYPTSVLGENFCSRWAMYANTPMANETKQQLYPQLRKSIAGKNQLAAVNILLNWVQTGFEYEYDDKVWGGDRAFFAEESLFYPYCDCEDRSILFTTLVRDLLGLKCILIYYPGHLASAVNFTEEVEGDYIILDGMKFIVSDPTYINAPVGYTMPDMNNATAVAILLE